jgi:hypothetical protein
MLESYRKIPFTEVYLFIKLDPEFLLEGQYFYENDLSEYLYGIFTDLSKDKIHIVHTRYVSQVEWKPFIIELFDKHGANESVWFTQNDDHIFIDFNTDVLTEGLTHLESDSSRHKSIYISHWPEILKLSGRQQEPVLVNNYVKFNLSLLDSVQIFNMQLLYDIFVQHQWKQNHIRIDPILLEICNQIYIDDPLRQTIYVPLRELVRHFDGYGHVHMSLDDCPCLHLPNNTFSYSKDELVKKMTAKHWSPWTDNNNFSIPEKWIDINLKLHDIVEYAL